MAETDVERFDDLLAQALPGDGHFGHRAHVKLTWLAVQRFGAEHARTLIESGLRRTARYAGAPQKYHATMSRAWVEAVAFHVGEMPGATFEQLVLANPGLLDKRLLLRFYRSPTLASPAAKTGWVPPDLHRFPWTPDTTAGS
jgi:hypothetical protein